MDNSKDTGFILYDSPETSPDDDDGSYRMSGDSIPGNTEQINSNHSDSIHTSSTQDTSTQDTLKQNYSAHGTSDWSSGTDNSHNHTDTYDFSNYSQPQGNTGSVNNTGSTGSTGSTYNAGNQGGFGSTNTTSGQSSTGSTYNTGSQSGLSGAYNGYDFNSSSGGSSFSSSSAGSNFNNNSGGSGGSSFNNNSGGSNFNSKLRKKKDKADSWFKQPVKLTKLKAIIAAAIIIVLATAAGFGGSLISSSVAPYGTSSLDSGKSSGSYNLEDATGSKLTVSEITAKNKNSVVEIKTESVATDSWMRQYVTEGAGSGVIIKSNGYIITNNHVISGANKITVTLSNEKEYTAKLIGTDSQLDVAVLKIGAKGLTPVTYGNSSQIKVGDVAVAIGNPLGTLGGTVTAGIISATQRTLTIDSQSMNLIQTDASINPGNSGGGLFNGDGQLVGLVVAKSSGSDVEGLGFAIPVNAVADTAAQLMKNGYVKNRANSGMAYSESSSSSDSASGGDESSDFFDYFMGGEEGQTTQNTPTVSIAQVISDEAKSAGFQEGDFVYSVDGTKIDSFATLKSIIQSHKPGDKVTYVIYRQNQKMKLKLTLVEEGKTNS